LAARKHGLGREGKRRRERADDPLGGHLERAGGTEAEAGLEPVELLDLDLADGVVAVRTGPLDDPGEGVALHGTPGDEQRAGALERDPGPRGVVPEQLVAAADEPGLERAGLRVEAGVEERRVGL